MATLDQLPPSPELPKYLQDPETTQEYRDLISSLPIERDLIKENFISIKGFGF
jgi:hypothetical protein